MVVVVWLAPLLEGAEVDVDRPGAPSDRPGAPSDLPEEPSDRPGEPSDLPEEPSARSEEPPEPLVAVVVQGVTTIGGTGIVAVTIGAESLDPEPLDEAPLVDEPLPLVDVDAVWACLASPGGVAPKPLEPPSDEPGLAGMDHDLARPLPLPSPFPLSPVGASWAD